MNIIQGIGGAALCIFAVVVFLTDPGRWPALPVVALLGFGLAGCEIGKHYEERAK